jgi:hypothetical protein
MISFRQKGDFSKLSRYLEKAKEAVNIGILDKYGREGVAALASVTPVETGLTASSWSYEIVRRNGSVAVEFHNSNIQNGVPIAIILQYGHGTRNGGWVQGRDYINPAIQPIFIKLANDAWREVTRT